MRDSNPYRLSSKQFALPIRLSEITLSLSSKGTMTRGIVTVKTILEVVNIIFDPIAWNGMCLLQRHSEIIQSLPVKMERGGNEYRA